MHTRYGSVCVQIRLCIEEETRGLNASRLHPLPLMPRRTQNLQILGLGRRSRRRRMCVCGRRFALNTSTNCHLQRLKTLSSNNNTAIVFPPPLHESNGILHDICGRSIVCSVGQDRRAPAMTLISFHGSKHTR